MSEGEAARAAPRKRASDEVADEIRAFMQRAGLRPGDRLGREQDLAERFGVSRPTLREALRALASAHLIRANKGPGGGIFVDATPEQGIGRSVSAAVAGMMASEGFEIEELLETRMLLEVPLAGLAAYRAREQDVARLEALIAEAEREHADPDAGRRVDAAIHSTIAEIADNRLAAAFCTWIVEVLQPSLAALIAPAVVESVVIDQHKDLLRAVARGDPAAAERAMREHIQYVADLVDAVRRTETPAQGADE